MQKPSITAIIPCYNEESSLPTTITRLKHVVDEVIAVDNGSTDKTVDIAKSMGVTVIEDPRKENGIGYGYALRSGLANANGDYIVTIDADGEHEIEKIPEIVSYLKKSEFDILSCNRITTLSPKLITHIRRIGIWILSFEVSLLFGHKIKDVLSGMWVMKNYVPAQLQLKSGDWNFSPEIKLAAINHPTINFAEYPIQATVRSQGKSKQVLWKTAIQHGLFILGYRIKTLPRLVKNITRSKQDQVELINS